MKRQKVKNMQSTLALDGRFRVTESGEVFKNTPAGEVPAKIHKSAHGGRYRAVSYTENGKQKHEYVHRLVAKAFLPNPNNLPIVNHIDGNPSNNAVSNLEWCTASENTRHAWSTGLIDKFQRTSPCSACGKVTFARSGICKDCQKQMRDEAAARKRSDKAADHVKIVDYRLLSPTETEYVVLMKAGFTQTDIARLRGVSRQCVHAAINSAIAKSQRGGRNARGSRG